MKKLQLYTGGHPLKLDNLNHLQSGLSEAFDGLIRGLIKNSSGVGLGAKLTGCEVSFPVNGNNAVVDAGYMIMLNLDGQLEVCKVEAHTVSKDSSENFLWTIDTDEYDSIDPQSYANNTDNFVHQMRRASLKAFGSGVLALADSAAKPFIDKIVGGPWTQLQTNELTYSTNNGSNWTVPQGGQTIKYQILGKTAHISIQLTDTTLTSSGNVILTMGMPAELKAKSDVLGTAFINSSDGTDKPAFCTILEGSSVIVVRHYGSEEMPATIDVLMLSVQYEID